MHCAARTDGAPARYHPGAVGSSGALDGFLPASKLTSQYDFTGSADKVLAALYGGFVLRHAARPAGDMRSV